MAWGKEQMAGYKYPRIVEFVDDLPMTATGKILKRELDEWRRSRSARMPVLPGRSGRLREQSLPAGRAHRGERG